MLQYKQWAAELTHLLHARDMQPDIANYSSIHLNTSYYNTFAHLKIRWSATKGVMSKNF